MNKVRKITWLACLVTLLTPGASLAGDQQEEAVDGSENCIRVNRIRSTKVVDDVNILFYMRGSKIYHNRLPRRCPGLGREGRFSYRSLSGNLCHIDSIRVLSGGAGSLEAGVSCRLGYFQEITEEDAEGIIEGLPRESEARPLPPAEPEDVTKEPQGS